MDVLTQILNLSMENWPLIITLFSSLVVLVFGANKARKIMQVIKSVRVLFLDLQHLIEITFKAFDDAKITKEEVKEIKKRFTKLYKDLYGVIYFYKKIDNKTINR